MIPLSPREEQIYNIYKAAIQNNQKIPTMREIGAQLDLSYAAVNTYTKRVITKGYLIRLRTIMMLPPTEEEEVVP